MRVLEVQFGTYTVYTGADGTPNTKKKFTAEQHDMHWLPEERLLLIDGWRYELGPGGRFMADPAPALPTDDTSMFVPLDRAPGVCTWPAEPCGPGVCAHQKVTDGTDQPGQPARTARKARRRKPG